MMKAKMLRQIINSDDSDDQNGCSMSDSWLENESSIYDLENNGKEIKMAKITKSKPKQINASDKEQEDQISEDGPSCKEGGEKENGKAT